MSWLAMIHRTTDPGAVDYHRYGGRGIAVCDRWRQSFQAFLADMGERPPGKTLDRYPGKNGNYEPGNCRWATAAEQGRNKRNNVQITFRGKTQCIAAWAEEVGLPRKTLERRIRTGRMSIDEAMTTPVISRQQRVLMGIASRRTLLALELAIPRKSLPKKAHCKWGHPKKFGGPDNSRAWCPTCNRLITRAWRAAKSAHPEISA